MVFNQVEGCGCRACSNFEACFLSIQKLVASGLGAKKPQADPVDWHMASLVKP